jgi:hypothetical protein
MPWGSLVAHGVVSWVRCLVVLLFFLREKKKEKRKKKNKKGNKKMVVDNEHGVNGGERRVNHALCPTTSLREKR